MPVIIKEFDVVAEPPAPQSNATQTTQSTPQMRPIDIEQIVRFLRQRRARLHAD